MSLRIAFDCDGVVADLDSVLGEIAVRLFGEAPRAGSEPAQQASAADGSTGSAADAADRDDGPTAEEVQVEPPRFRALTRHQQHEIWEAARNTRNFWESLPETVPGAVARLAALARERRWEVIFITQRPSSDGDTTQVQTQRWLAALGFDLPSVFVIKGSRGQVADALSLDIVVDDRPENCLDVKLGSRARAILVWGGDFVDIPPNAQRLGIEPVAGIGGCLDRLSGEGSERPGLFARMKRVIGS